MARPSLKDIKNKLSRLFLGRIVIHEIGPLHRPQEEMPAVTTHFRSITTSPIRTTPRVGSALFVEWKHTKAKPAGSILGRDIRHDLKVESGDLSLDFKVNVSKFRLRLPERCAAKNGMWRVKNMPQTRYNRINFLKKQPKFANSSLLALYTPIYQARVKSSSLDKQTGKLKVWYHQERIRLGEKSHLLLLRVFNAQEPLRWVWLPAEKKIG